MKVLFQNFLNLFRTRKIILQKGNRSPKGPFDNTSYSIGLFIKGSLVFVGLALLVYMMPQGFQAVKNIFLSPADEEVTTVDELPYVSKEQDIINLDQHNLRLILQAYNAGPGKVRASEGNIHYPETISYVERAFNLMEVSSLPTPYNEIIEEVSPYFGLDPHLVKTIVLLESGGESHHISDQGARGLMQITRSTWYDMTDEIGVDWSYDKVFDAYKNIVIGCAYLQWLRDSFFTRTYTSNTEA